VARILNKRTASKGLLKNAIYVGRPGTFGNPFQIGRDGGREEVVRLYRKWFAKKVAEDARFRGAVEALRGKDLSCWCAPARCHAEVILEYLSGGKKK